MSDAKDSKDSGGGNQKLVMILTMVNLIVVVAIGAIVFISFKKENAKPSVGDIAVEEEVAEESHGGGHGAPPADGHGGGHDKPAKKKGEVSGKWITLDQFTVNLNTPGGGQQKFARVNISVEVENDEVEGEVQAKMPQVRNTVIDLFNSKRPSDLSSSEGRDFLREEIKTSLKSFITSGKVKGVYFTNFAVTS